LGLINPGPFRERRLSLKFGTSGLRGLSVDLVGKASVLYATAFARHLLESNLAKPGDRLLIARDFRPSSPEIMLACASAVAAAGFLPVDCGTIPTPALALYGLSIGAASMMITGSHIPADRNGIKFYRPDGEIDKGDELAITAIAARLALGIGDVDPVQPEDGHAAAAHLFLERNKKLLPNQSLKGLKVGVYQHSTVARAMFVDVLQHYGAEVLALGWSDMFIPVDTEAVSESTVDLLKAWTREHGLDAIVSADGDGDRPMVSDETGTPLRGDLLGLLTARFLKAETVVTPVTSNSGIEGAGTYQVVRTKVGSPYVIAAMDEAKAAGKSSVMGFEANGGLLTGTDFLVNGAVVSALPTRDSFLPVLAVLSTAANARQSLSGLAATVNLPIALSDRLENFAVEKSAAFMAYIRASQGNLETFLAGIGTPVSVSDIDGVRVTLADGGIIHFRPSGNAPEMRCYVEAEDAAAAQVLMRQGLSALAAWVSPKVSP
jgi:phosphomannomutase